MDREVSPALCRRRNRAALLTWLLPLLAGVAVRANEGPPLLSLFHFLPFLPLHVL
jgi:hypothetical protein